MALERASSFDALLLKMMCAEARVLYFLLAREKEIPYIRFVLLQYHGVQVGPYHLWSGWRGACMLATPRSLFGCGAFEGKKREGWDGMG